MSAAFAEEWQRWHAARERAVLAPHGVASLTVTAWLTPDPRVIDGVVGQWRADGDRVVGSGLSGSGYRESGGGLIEDEVVLRPGEVLADGERELRAYARDGAPALRVFDPQAASRLRVAGIDAWEPSEQWSVAARFEPVDTPREVESVDGYRSFAAATGLLHLVTPDGRERTLDATVATDALSIVFADATSGRESYRFRFLRVDLPDAEGRTHVDFSRAFLPPCAFSDHYVCPLPSARNRLDLAVEAGETTPRLRAAAEAR